jgi:chromosome segregation ATPase
MDKKHLHEQMKALEGQLNKTTENKLEVERRAEALKREIDLLTQDKGFLQREGTSLEDKVRRLEDKLDRTELSLLESKKQAEKYMDRVLNTNDDLKMKFDEKYQTEMENLKTRYNKDLELIKQNMMDVYEVKTNHLTERKDELEIRQHKLEKQL